MLVGQQAARFYQVVDTFPLVRNLHRAEQHELLVLRKEATVAGFLSVAGFEEVGVDGVGDARHGMSAEEGACAGAFFQPVAACHEVDSSSFIKVHLLPEDTVGRSRLLPPSWMKGQLWHSCR